MEKWTRRSVLAGGLLAPVSCAGILGSKSLCGNALPTKGLAVLTSLYSDLASVRALGEKYLSVASASASAALRRLQTDKRLAKAVQSGCTIGTASAVESACREDFRAGHFYCIDGWVLARTELDIAAVCTLA